MNHQEVIKQARTFWTHVAEANGWSMEDCKVQVWLTEAGDISDSVYLPGDSQYDLVVDRQGRVTAYDAAGVEVQS